MKARGVAGALPWFAQVKRRYATRGHAGAIPARGLKPMATVKVSRRDTYSA